MAEDRYKDFAERYDLFFDAFGEYSAERVSFFRTLFAQNRTRSVLDCACGTGRDLPLFQSLGVEVVGSDVSKSMLAQAEKNLDQLGVAVPLEHVDYRELRQHYDREFDAVVCLSSSLLEVPDETEAVRALRSMREVLSGHGIVVLSQGTTDKQWNQKPRFIPAVKRPDFSRVFVIDYEKTGARYNVLDIFHSDEQSDFRVWTAHYHIMLLRDDLERLLKDAGFSKTEFYGSYGFDPYDKTSSDILISIAQK